VEVTAASSDASLASLVSTAGTLSPIFDTDTFSYSLPVPNGTTSITITATPTNAGAVAYINGQLSGGSGTAITTAVGITNVVVTVFAPSITDTRTYQIAVTRAS